jgi:hypothetical protein
MHKTSLSYTSANVQCLFHMYEGWSFGIRIPILPYSEACKEFEFLKLIGQCHKIFYPFEHIDLYAVSITLLAVCIRCR